MKIINLTQGTPEWHAHRAKHLNASDAPVVMGARKDRKRNKLLDEKATGIAEDPSSFQEKIFDNGHRVEAIARPFIEDRIGGDLFPVTGQSEDDPRLSASFDGITEKGDLICEIKQWNKGKAPLVQKGTVPTEDIWQVVHQFAVNDEAQICLYVLTDGTDEGTITCEVKRADIESMIPKLIAAWDQFEKDLAEHTPAEPQQETVAAQQTYLPAVSVNVSGDIDVRDNLREFGQALTTYVEGLNLEPTTDQEFADLDAAVKRLKEAEQSLTTAEESALAQVDQVQQLRNAINEYRETARQARLAGEKAVKNEKEKRKKELINETQRAFDDYAKGLENEFSEKVVIPEFNSGFASAVHGKKNLESMRSALSDRLADTKIQANEWAARIRTNLESYHSVADGYETLFPDLQSLVEKAPEDFDAAVKNRIREHEEEQKRRREAEEAKKAQAEQPEQPSTPAEPEPSATTQDSAPKPSKGVEVIESGFDLWWWDIGSGVQPREGEDYETFGRRIAEMAWNAATEK